MKDWIYRYSLRKLREIELYYQTGALFNKRGNEITDFRDIAEYKADFEYACRHIGRWDAFARWLDTNLSEDMDIVEGEKFLSHREVVAMAQFLNGEINL